MDEIDFDYDIMSARESTCSHDERRMSIISQWISVEQCRQQGLFGDLQRDMDEGKYRGRRYNVYYDFDACR